MFDQFEGDGYTPPPLHSTWTVRTCSEDYGRPGPTGVGGGANGDAGGTAVPAVSCLRKGNERRRVAGGLHDSRDPVVGHTT
jgi:hypothetical protein